MTMLKIICGFNNMDIIDVLFVFDEYESSTKNQFFVYACQ